MSDPFTHLSLTRPLVVFDLETTGLDPQADRVVEIALLRASPAARPLRDCLVLHPGRPIPAAATAVHSLTDVHVAGAPPFAAVAPYLWQVFADADVAGFNVARFDLPLLLAEFDRAGLPLDLAGRAVLDAAQLFHRREPRDLGAAVRLYCGRAHPGRHHAAADVEAAAAVLDAQLGRYPDPPRSAAGLHAWLHPVDAGGCFRLEGGRVVFAFGRHAGRALEDVAREAPGFLLWILRQGFLPDAKELVCRALDAGHPGSHLV